MDLFIYFDARVFFPIYIIKTHINDKEAPKIAKYLIFSINIADKSSNIPTMSRSKNLSVNPADSSSCKVILLSFLPASAFITSPAVRNGEKFPAKSPIVLTM